MALGHQMEDTSKSKDIKWTFVHIHNGTTIDMDEYISICTIIIPKITHI